MQIKIAQIEASAMQWSLSSNPLSTCMFKKFQWRYPVLKLASGYMYTYQLVKQISFYIVWVQTPAEPYLEYPLQ